jgi:hypothetical protein
MDGGESRRCPVCGRGDLIDIAYTEGSSGEVPIQESDTRQVETYSCGHERVGPRLDEPAAPGSALDVERRSSQETAPESADADEGPGTR